MEKNRGHRGAQEIVAEVEQLDMKATANAHLLSRVDQDQERDQLRRAKEGSRNDDEGQGHLVRLVPGGPDRKRMRQHPEPTDGEEDHRIG